MNYKDSRILNPKKSIQDLLRLRTKEEQMKWLIEKGDRDSSWTWWLRQLSRITNRSRKMKIKESLPSILPERNPSLKMKKEEIIDSISKELPPRITFYNRSVTKVCARRKRKGETRSRLRSGRKKQLNTLRPKSKKPRISEILIKNTPKSFYLCLKTTRGTRWWTKLNCFWIKINSNTFLLQSQGKTWVLRRSSLTIRSFTKSENDFIYYYLVTEYIKLEF